MPVRTSVVVAGGLLLLAVLGITTIFGDSLLAWIAPPAPEGLSAGVTGGLNPPGSSSKASPGAPPTSGAGGAADNTERNP